MVREQGQVLILRIIRCVDCAQIRRVRRIATKLGFCPTGTYSAVREQGEVRILWIRRRAIRICGEESPTAKRFYTILAYFSEKYKPYTRIFKEISV